MKYILSLMLSRTALLSWGQCNIYFNVYDSYGDGWNGAGAEVFLNGESQGFRTVLRTCSASRLIQERTCSCFGLREITTTKFRSTCWTRLET